MWDASVARLAFQAGIHTQLLSSSTQQYEVQGGHVPFRQRGGSLCPPCDHRRATVPMARKYAYVHVTAAAVPGLSNTNAEAMPMLRATV